MWFWIWLIIVLGTGVAAAFLFRDLWRRTKTTGRAVAGISAALDSWSDKIAELEKNPPGTTPRRPDVFADRAELARRVAIRRKITRARRDARRAGHAARCKSWQMLDR